MSYYLWEPEVEFFETVKEPSFSFERIPFAEISLNDSLMQEASILYEADRNRSVMMRVLGFLSTTPVVSVTVKSDHESRLISSAQIMGCMLPDKNTVIPAVLRTWHRPLLQSENERSIVLPTPTRNLRIKLPRVI